MTLFGTASTDDTAGTMLDDSLGALTQSVFDATAKTQQTFEKLVPKLQSLESKSNLFSTHLAIYQKELATALKSAAFHLKRSLSGSMRMTNGISDEASNRVLASLVKRMTKANDAIVQALNKKDMLGVTMDGESKDLVNLTRDIQSKTQKSFAVLNVADKIAANAKALQETSKSVTERAEKMHLARASPAVHEGVLRIQQIIDNEKKVMPFRPVVSQLVIPAKFTKTLGEAYVATRNAIDHAEKAMSLSGAARSREVVDLRDQVREGLDDSAKAVRIKELVIDPEINDKIVPFNLQVGKVVAQQLIPAMRSYNVANRHIIDQIDVNRVQQIMHHLERQVMKQSCINSPIFTINRRQFNDFF